MPTECNRWSFDFQPLGNREVTARFDGGRITSDAGGLLLREVERRFGFIERFAHCFTDHRDPEQIEHPLVDLLKQRIFGLCLGYEDLLDHDALRHDPLLAVMVGKSDPLGEQRDFLRDRGKALAGKSTLNRLELTPPGAAADSRYKKITAHLHHVQEFLVEAFLQQHDRPPRRIVLDFDATDDPVHGQQLGRFFHGYYRHYCFLPLYVFCGDHPLLALLRPADLDAAAGAIKQLARIVARLRQAWPEVPIVVRADSGFCREALLAWCEAHGVDYVIGLAKNQRLVRAVGKQLHEAEQQFQATGRAARVFHDFPYRTHQSWSRPRRVIGKAEHLAQGANPRFVVTSLPAPDYEAQLPLRRGVLCARRDGESDQGTAVVPVRRSHQLPDSTGEPIAVGLLDGGLRGHPGVREFGLGHTSLATARADTIRWKLFKIGALVRISVRRVWVALSESYPWQQLFQQVCRQLSGTPPRLDTG